MKIVLLESLGISQEILDQYAQKLKAKGHTFENYPKDTDPKAVSYTHLWSLFFLKKFPTS